MREGPWKRQVSSVWVVALSLLILILPFAGLAIAIPRLVRQRWDQMGRECRKRAADLQRKDGRRSALRGSSVPGNAWSDYREAWKLLGSSKLAYLYGDFPDCREEPSSEELAAWMEPGLPALDRLRRGASRAESRCERDWSRFGEVGFSMWRFVPLGLVRSRLLAEQGDAAEAADLLLDLIRIVGDTARDGTWMDGSNAHYQQRRLLLGLNRLMDAGLLDRDQLRDIVRQLDLLEADLPPFGEGMLNAAMAQGFLALRVGDLEGAIPDQKLPPWRWGDLGRLTLIRAYEVEQSAAELIAAGDAKPWPEARQITRKASADVVASGNYVLTGGDPKSRLDYSLMQKTFRENAATLRLVRAAALFRADGTLPDAEDPCGARLCWSKRGARLKIWSAGSDGVDDGGSGSLDPKAGRDLVLEVRR